MNSQNLKTESVVRPESVEVSGDMHEALDLSISEDDDQGSDPYNSTGQHVILNSKLELQD